jgi:16S rRNA (guanine966-N2)-methyltransferase
VRVVAGTAKGHRLVAPPGRHTRPTTDRVREALFSMVASRVDLDGATVVDLFAGSGALGIEALSRGAAHATFVDADRAAVTAIRANLAATGLADRATVVRADALRWLGAGGDRRFDVALADPPYAFDAWPTLLGCLRAGLAVLESAAEPDLPPGWDVLVARRHGGTLVTVARPAPTNEHRAATETTH